MWTGSLPHLLVDVLVTIFALKLMFITDLTGPHRLFQ
jgi:hypothetical protein